jgi:hypothetical protein
MKHYDTVIARIHWPYQYGYRWVKRGKAYICQYRMRKSRGRWTGWIPVS